MTTILGPSVRMVTDPHDHKERPFCNSIGKLFFYASTTKRYCKPTPEEDSLWQAAGQRQIDEAQARRQRRLA